MSITRKGRENYCFVSFDDADEAREFMARHNHQLLREFFSRDKEMCPLAYDSFMEEGVSWRGRWDYIKV